MSKSELKDIESANGWNDQVRGWVSILLAIHLIGLGLLFWSYLGRIDAQSLLISRARRVVDPYLVPLALDRGWGGEFTSSDDIDSDHYLKVIVHGKNGKLTEHRFPNERSNLPEERVRWQRLALFVGTHPSSPDADRVINQLGKHLLERYQTEDPAAERLEIECRRRLRVPFLLDQDDVDPFNTYWDQKPLYVVFVKKDGFWKKSLDARDFAPVIADPQKPSPPQTPASTPTTSTTAGVNQ
jgi:hypothetical protein